MGPYATLRKGRDSGHNEPDLTEVNTLTFG